MIVLEHGILIDQLIPIVVQYFECYVVLLICVGILQSEEENATMLLFVSKD